MSFNNTVESIINTITEKIGDNVPNKTKLQKICKEVLMDHQDEFGNVFTKAPKEKAKWAVNWSGLWRSPDWGVKKYFPKEYARVKKDLGGDYRFFHIIIPQN